MLFNGKFAFCHFSLLFNRNLSIEKLWEGDVRMYGCTDARTDERKFTPVSYRTLALWGRCPKRQLDWRNNQPTDRHSGLQSRVLKSNLCFEGIIEVRICCPNILVVAPCMCVWCKKECVHVWLIEGISYCLVRTFILPLSELVSSSNWYQDKETHSIVMNCIVFFF